MKKNIEHISEFYLDGFRYRCAGQTMNSPLVTSHHDKEAYDILCSLNVTGRGKLLQKIESSHVVCMNKDSLVKSKFEPGKNPRVTVVDYNLHRPGNFQENLVISWQNFLDLGKPKFLSCAIRGKATFSKIEELSEPFSNDFLTGL